MPTTAGQPPGDFGRVLGVVEYKQPPAPLPQLPQHRRPHRLHARPGLHTAQRHAQGGELIADQSGLLGVDPPGQVVGPGEPVRVLDRQLGLAHPAHPLERLHHRPVPGQQPLPHRHQQSIPTGKPQVTGWEIPHPRQAVPAAADPRPPASAGRPACRSRGTPAPHPAAWVPARLPAVPAAPRPRPGRPDRRKSAAAAPRARLPQARPPPAPAPDDPARFPARARSAAVHSSVVYRGRSKYAGENSASTRSHRASASLIASMKFWPTDPVPGVQLDGVPGVSQLPGHPLRPRPVCTGMTDEEILPVPTHTNSIPPSTLGRHAKGKNPGRPLVQGWPAECTCPPLQHQA